VGLLRLSNLRHRRHSSGRRRALASYPRHIGLHRPERPIGRTPKKSKPRVSGAFSVRNRPFRDGHHIGRSHSWAYSPLSLASRGGSVSHVTQSAAVKDYTSICSFYCFVFAGRDSHGKPVGLSKESARTRGVAQGKCRSRFHRGNRHTGDGLGRSQFYRTTRWSGRNLNCHCRRSEALDLFIVFLSVADTSDLLIRGHLAVGRNVNS
jgi:hypothetical protein